MTSKKKKQIAQNSNSSVEDAPHFDYHSRSHHLNHSVYSDYYNSEENYSTYATYGDDHLQEYLNDVGDEFLTSHSNSNTTEEGDLYENEEATEGEEYSTNAQNEDEDGVDSEYSDSYVSDRTSVVEQFIDEDDEEDEEDKQPSIAVQPAMNDPTIQSRPILSYSKFISPKGCPKNWNGEFQNLLSLPEGTEEQRIEKYSRLSSLYADFVHTAKVWGKIIISEAAFEREQRTINPQLDISGQAGGKKYIYHGILFKFALDWKSIYGSEEKAQKAAGHELIGVMRYAQCEGLHVPLMALIDYRGYRLIAVSLLPISSNTLRYGSNDCGKTVLNSDPVLNNLMKQAGEQLNIKGHFGGTKEEERKFIYGPTDIEGHLGNDSRYYVLDFARVFPPTVESDIRRSYIYKLFRPEFIKNYRIPLSSDAFSPFGRDNREEHNTEVKEATEYLFNVTIPEFAAELEVLCNEIDVESQLTELVHRAGINVRYLGLIRKNLSSKQLQSIVLNEMCARVIKNRLKEKLRMQGEKLKTLAEDLFRQVIIKFLNIVLGHHNGKVEASLFWKKIMKEELSKLFVNSLSTEEMADSYDLKKDIFMPKLFKRIQQITGVKLTKDALKDLKNNPDNFNIVNSDINKVTARVKHMNIMSLAEGNALSLMSMRSDKGADRLFRLAMSKFDSAIQATPDNQAALNNYADVLVNYAMTDKFPTQSHQFFVKAFEKYKMAKNWVAILHLPSKLLSIQLTRWKERDSLMNLAHQCYQSVSDYLSKNQDCEFFYETYFQWATLLINQVQNSKIDQHYPIAGEKFKIGLQNIHSKLNNRNANNNNKSNQKKAAFGKWALELDHSDLAVLLEMSLTSPNLLEFNANNIVKRKFITSKVLLSLVSNVNLKQLNLQHCSHLSSVELCKILENCSKLENLNLSFCNLNQTCFQLIGRNSKSLKYLSISNCNIELQSKQFDNNVNINNNNANNANNHEMKQLKVSINTMFRECTELVELDLTGNPEIFNSETIDEITFFCPKIEHFNLSKHHFSTQSFTKLGKSYKHIRSLNLSSAFITSSSLNEIHLYFTESLVSLDLSEQSNLSNHILKLILTKCKQIQYLNVNNNSNLHYFDEFSLATNLTSLSMLNVEINDAFLSNIQNCNNLQTLRVNKFHRKMNLNAIKNFLLSMKNMQQLQFPCSKINDEIANVFLNHHFCNIKILDFSNSDLSDEGIKAITCACTNLEEFSIADVLKLSDKCLEYLSTCKKIKLLNISGCKLITDNGLKMIGSFFWLKDLNISRLQCISSVDPIAEGCPNLTSLNIKYCQQLLNKSVARLVKDSPLEYLNLYGCKRVNEEILIYINEFCPSLRRLEIGNNKIPSDSLDHFISNAKDSDLEVILKREQLNEVSYSRSPTKQKLIKIDSVFTKREKRNHFNVK